LLVSLEGEKVRLLVSAREGFDPAFFIGNPCAGELAPIFASAKVLIDFEQCLFPKNALAMLSCGGNVVCEDESKKVYLDSDGVKFLDRVQILNPSQKENLFWESDSKKLHAHANRFHGTRFKRKVEATVQHS